MDSTFVENADNTTILVKYLMPSIVMTIVLLAGYAVYKWKIKADKREIDELNPERMQLRMQALAVEKLAQRKNKEEAGQEASVTTTETDPPDENSDGELVNRL